MAARPIFVDLPPERARPGYCCRLLRSLYGTRDAPQLWEEYAATALERGLPVLTGNVREFSQVDGLRVIDYAAA